MKRFVPKFLAVLLVLMLVCASAIADTVYALCKPGDIVNVRRFPKTKCEDVGRLDCGDPVETEWETRTDNHGGKWVRVYGFEGDAWVSARYLSNSPVTIVTCECYAYVCANGRTALRRAPNGKRTRWLNNGDMLKVLAFNDEWILTTRGYVKAECVEVEYGRADE